jgi:hypothetical protein
VSDIHEFGRFWMSHLGLSSSQDVDWMVPDKESASLTLQALRAIQSEFNKPIVMKGIYPAYCYKWLNEQMGDQIKWIHIKRDPVDACISILDARRKKLRDKNAWFGWHIPESERRLICDTKPHWQIAYQVTFFQDAYDEISDTSVWLEDLCDIPSAMLEECTTGDYIIERPPPKLEYNEYEDRKTERAWFKEILRTV